MVRFNVAGLIAFVIGALGLAAVAQDQTKQSVSPEQTHLSYTPELADLMNITQTLLIGFPMRLKAATGSLPHMKPHVCVRASILQ